MGEEHNSHINGKSQRNRPTKVGRDGQTTEISKRSGDNVHADAHLSALDFNPDLLGRDSKTGVVVFERFE